jgi:WD40 repeat protein
MKRNTKRYKAPMFESPIAYAILILGVSGQVCIAQSAGAFTATGNLTRPRQFHTATLLPTGKVLIAGGSSVLSSVWASAELYDPSTGSFIPTGDMTTPRSGHTSTLLPNGKVLIAGGTGSFGAELYDSSTGAFAATGDMTMPRSGHTATLLNSGKVLIAGGSNLASAELYDPSTGTFTATGDMTAVRSWPSLTATLLANGKVLVAGASADLFDPDTRTFSLTSASTNMDESLFTATLLPNGKVLLPLTDSEMIGKSVEVYDPGNSSITPTGNMTIGRGYSTATLLADGNVLLAGRDNIHFGGSAELYQTATGTFSANGGMLTQSAEGHAATLLPNGTVLLTGGWVCCGFTIATAEIFRPTVLSPAPVLFSLSGDGGGQGAIWHSETGQIASSEHPAVAGDALSMYTTSLSGGSVIPPQVAIGGRLAEILFFGNAPGYPGFNQVNVRVPGGIAPGGADPVRLTYLGRPSNEVTIAVQ